MMKRPLTVTVIPPDGSVERLGGGRMPRPSACYPKPERRPQDRRTGPRPPADPWRGRVIDLVG